LPLLKTWERVNYGAYGFWVGGSINRAFACRACPNFRPRRCVRVSRGREGRGNPPPPPNTLCKNSKRYNKTASPRVLPIARKYYATAWRGASTVGEKCFLGGFGPFGSLPETCFYNENYLLNVNVGCKTQSRHLHGFFRGAHIIIKGGYLWQIWTRSYGDPLARWLP
jgi:hypothetical protein